MAGSNTDASGRFGSLDDLVAHFDAHDLGDEVAAMPVADFEVALESKSRLVQIDEVLAARLTEIARKRRVTPEKLIDAWLREQVARAS